MQHLRQQPAARRALVERALGTVAAALKDTLRGESWPHFHHLVPAPFR